MEVEVSLVHAKFCLLISARSGVIQGDRSGGGSLISSCQILSTDLS